MARIGKFVVSGDFYKSIKDAPEQGIKMQEGMAVLRVEHCFPLDELEYFAVGPMFDYVPEGQVIPLYECIVTEHQRIEDEAPEYIYSFKRID